VWLTLSSVGSSACLISVDHLLEKGAGFFHYRNCIAVDMKLCANRVELTPVGCFEHRSDALKVLLTTNRLLVVVALVLTKQTWHATQPYQRQALKWKEQTEQTPRMNRLVYE
jgi:hypothetical protein